MKTQGALQATGTKPVTPKGEDAKRNILRAANKVFARYSYKAASTRKIAEEAGIEHPLIHYYFGSKKRLFAEVAQTNFAEFRELHEKWLEDLHGKILQGEFKGLDEILGFYIDRFMEYCWDNPDPLTIVVANISRLGKPGSDVNMAESIDHFQQVKKMMTERLNIPDHVELESYVQSFNALLLVYVGARSYQAALMGMDPESQEYRAWVKETLVLVFTPWLQRLLEVRPAEELLSR